MSRAQERILFNEQLAPGSQNLAKLWRLTGPLDETRFAAAFDAVLARHDVLHLGFRTGQEGFSAFRGSCERATLEALQLAQHLAPESEARRISTQIANAPFDLRKPPLVRALLMLSGSDERYLLLVAHHAVFDGTSLLLFLEQWSQAYAQLRAGTPVALPSAGATWSRVVELEQRALAERAQALSDYWRNELAQVEPDASPLWRAPADASYRAESVRVPVPAHTRGALRALQAKLGVTPFSLLLAAFQAALVRGTGADEVLTGVAASGRTRAELERAMGPLINTILVRCRLSSGLSFAALAKDVQRRLYQGMRHQALPLQDVIHALSSEGMRSRQPLSRSTLVFRPAARLALAGVNALELELEPALATDDLVLEVEDGDTLRMVLRYRASIVERFVAEQLAAGFAELLSDALANPDQPVQRLRLVSELQRDALRVMQSGPRMRSDSPDVMASFAHVAQATPEHLALVCGDEELSYGALHDRVVALARELRSRGLGQGDVVGLCFHRSTELVVSLLAVLECGAAYLPLDAFQPVTRLEQVLADSGAAAVLSEPALRSRFSSLASPERLCGVGREDVLFVRTSTRAALGTPQEPLAYVIYTSGSTGTPKGVIISRRNLAAFLDGMDDVLSSDLPLTFLAVTNLTFDIAVLELLWTLSRGATVVMHPEFLVAQRRPGGPATANVRTKITHLQCTPSLAWAMLDDPAHARLFEGLHTLVLGGEACPPLLVQALREKTRARLINAYGPTEATVWATIHAVTDVASSIPIGKPIANTTVHVLDRELQPVPQGLIGELYIGGQAVAQGYLNRPELTAERFLPDPFVPGARVYRTGDLARWNERGELEFFGRKDSQVKLRGHRIELGEVESALMRHHDVQAAAVLLHGSGERAALHAYVVLRSGDATASELRSFARTALPEAMVPSSFTTLDALPLLPSGKLHRSALPAPTSTEPVDCAQTPMEQAIAEIWCEVLGRETVSRDASFFELGGHSLLAVRVISRVRERLGVEPALAWVFESPTLASFAARLEQHAASHTQPAAAASSDLDVPRSVGAPTLSFAQEQLSWLDWMSEASSAYNHQVLLRWRGPLHDTALEHALHTIVERHLVLRSRIVNEEGRPSARLATTGVLPLGHVSVERTEDPEAEVLALATREANRPFDLAEEAPIRFTVFRAGPAQHWLLVVAHHVVWDAWSAGILARELGELYAANVEHRKARLQPLSLQYGDYAAWQRNRLADDRLRERLQSYWRNALPEGPALDLPTDKKRPAVATQHGASVAFTIPSEARARLVKLAEAEGATLFMVLLAAFQLTLQRYAGEKDIRVGVPVAGRSRASFESLIGCFVNVVVMRAALQGNPTVRELLHRTREVALGAFAHDELPFPLLVEHLNPPRDLSRSPLCQAMLVLQNAPFEELSVPSAHVERVDLPLSSARFDLTLIVEPRGEALKAWLNYSTDLFEAATAERMASELTFLLDSFASYPGARLDDPLLGSRLGFTELDRALDDRVLYPDLYASFARWADATPEAPAVSFAGRTMSYRQLRVASEAFARRLASLSIPPRSRVALLVDMGFDLTVYALGTLHAGAVMVCLDPSQPAEHTERLLAEVAPSCVVVSPSVDLPEAVRTFIEQSAIPVLSEALASEDEDARIAGIGVEAAAGPADRTRPAYVVYTSGSTGRPKGIEQSHVSFGQFLAWQAQEFDIRPGRRIAVWSPLNYDASYCELLGALCFGATACLVPRHVRLSPRETLEWLREERVYLLQTVPSFATQLLEVVKRDPAHAALPDLALVLLSGEVLPPAFAHAWLVHFGGRPRLCNLYGPSEAVLATYHWVDEMDDATRPISIGREIAGRQVVLMDELGRPCPPGARGELYIRSPFLTNGYVERAEETRAAFSTNPYGMHAHDRLYRTGDFARRAPDGNLEFFGRKDQQLKIRGHRVELGEIEAKLRAHPLVKEACVVPVEVSGDRRLAAYVCPGSIDPQALRTWLLAKLPPPFQPSYFVGLERLPRTTTGKVDRARLPSPAFDELSETDARGVTTSETDTEALVARIWCAVLGVPQVGPHDSFFALGGHSLLLARVQSELEAALSMRLPLVMLFQHPTVRTLASHLERVANGVSEPSLASERVDSMPRRARYAALRARRQADTKHNGRT